MYCDLRDTSDSKLFFRLIIQNEMLDVATHKLFYKRKSVT